MARNAYPGICYRCQKPCAAGDGHFERHRDGWRVQHATCAIEHRRTWDDINGQTPNERTKARAERRKRAKAHYVGAPHA